VLNEVENYIKQVSASNMYYYYQNKGKLKLALNKYPAAITDFSKALEVAEAQQMVDSKATILTHLAKAYRLNKQTVDAAHYINESKEIAEKNKLDNELSDAYEELILLQRDLGNYKEAFEYLLLQNSLKSKMVNIEKINHISMLEKKLALSEKQKEIEQEKLKAQHAKENSEQLMYLVGCITLVALLAIFMFIRTRKLHRKIIIQNKKLELKNHIIEEKQKEILDSIHYAKRIQNALITSERSIDNSLKKLMKGK
jgi:tetratricopeptide (TPR) repeat protein